MKIYQMIDYSKFFSPTFNLKMKKKLIEQSGEKNQHKRNRKKKKKKANGKN